MDVTFTNVPDGRPVELVLKKDSVMCGERTVAKIGKGGGLGSLISGEKVVCSSLSLLLP